MPSLSFPIIYALGGWRGGGGGDLLAEQRGGASTMISGKGRIVVHKGSRQGGRPASDLLTRQSRRQTAHQSIGLFLLPIPDFLASLQDNFNITIQSPPKKIITTVAIKTFKSYLFYFGTVVFGCLAKKSHTHTHTHTS